MLIISTGSRLAPGFILVDQQLLQALGNTPSVRVETYAENLDLVRFPSERYQRIFSDYLAAKYAEFPPDLVILVYVGNLGIAGKVLPELFPGTPIIVAGLTEEEFRPNQFSLLVSGIAQRVNPRASLEFILRLQPETRRIVVIGGAAEVDRNVIQRLKESAHSFKGRIEIDFWDNLSMAELRQAVTTLPGETAILFARMFRDAAGQAFISSQVGQSIAQLANVPVYVMADANMGTAAVGGSVASIEAFGKRAGELARLVLNGADIKSLPFEIRTDSVPTVNWPALQRWGIPETRLPPGSVVLRKPMSIWAQYRWYIIGAIIIIGIEAAMIAALLVQRRRRRRAEQQARALNRRLVTAHEDERRRLARDLHDDLTQRLARLAIDAGKIERSAPVSTHSEAGRSMREDLVRLSEDVHDLSYRLHPSLLDDLGLVEALNAECDGVSRRESIAVGFKPCDVPRDIPPETALGLFRVAQESLRNVARHAGASAVEISLRQVDGGLEMAISDNGAGFDPGQHRVQPSLGLASMKERLQLLGGELDIDSAPGQGTTIVAWLRLNGEGKS